MVKETALNTIKENVLIERNQHIVLGLSGGPDSVCLFHILCGLAEDMNLKIYPVHINHKFRPGAAERDQEYSERISLEAGWTCRSFIFDCNKIAEEKRITSEEAGRKVRYYAFAKVASELISSGINPETVKIAVAQNADDQAETILFRILRGAGTDGLSGMSYKRRDEYGNLIIRPLLDVKKADILKYCSENGLHPCVDKTNDEPIYTRNKIRLKLIPLLEKEYNSNIKDTIIRMGKIAARDKDCLWEEARSVFAESIITKSDKSILLKGAVLRELHPAMRQRVIAIALKEIGLAGDVTFVHFEGCDEIIFNEKPSACFNLPHGYYITKVYDDVKLAEEVSTPKAHRIKVSVATREEYERMKLPRNGHGAFDLEEVKKCLGEDAAAKIRIRNRMKGDFIPIGSGSKKIQDCFVDDKIPRNERDSVEMVACGSEILWILPNTGRGRYSSKYKLSENTKNVIIIEIIGLV